MQEFIANGRVANIPEDAVGKTANGNVSFKFDFVCDSSLLDEQQQPLSTFFPVQVYGKQAEIMAQSLSKGSPILIKGEIIQRVYTDKNGQRRTHQYLAPAQIAGITFLENKTAAEKRRQSQQTVFVQLEQQQSQPFQAVPVDVDEPF
ncbi:single-stranded DNA-binding protein [Streptococcus sp. UBA4344]|uniref:single-stranded DNA-binding protein n=2 Tax=Streptococcus TaxID=1301 RepID=UPI002579A1C8|nr:single-stranded DNA-binding protein [Streptococcus sp. UBA4344]